MAEALVAGWRAWRDQYRQAVEQTMLALRHLAALATRAETGALMAALERSLPAELRGRGAAARAIAVLASTPGVSAVLVGMRRPEYVRQALTALPAPLPTSVRPIYERARAHVRGES
jgi:aryl-alcohol dehydrogenase-like predicted oxidoreductase